MSLKRRPRILVIDDDSDITEFIAIVLSAKDNQVTVAHTVEEGLTGFATYNYDMVFMDLFMDGVAGIEGIKMIRESDSNVPIVSISAGYKDLPPDDALKAALKIGADRVLAKPFTVDDLANLTDEVLESRPS